MGRRLKVEVVAVLEHHGLVPGAQPHRHHNQSKDAVDQRRPGAEGDQGRPCPGALVRRPFQPLIKNARLIQQTGSVSASCKRP